MDIGIFSQNDARRIAKATRRVERWNQNQPFRQRRRWFGTTASEPAQYPRLQSIWITGQYLLSDVDATGGTDTRTENPFVWSVVQPTETAAELAKIGLILDAGRTRLTATKPVYFISPTHVFGDVDVTHSWSASDDITFRISMRTYNASDVQQQNIFDETLHMAGTIAFSVGEQLQDWYNDWNGARYWYLETDWYIEGLAQIEATSGDFTDGDVFVQLHMGCINMYEMAPLQE